MYRTLRRSTAVPFVDAAAASGRGELVEVIGGRRAVAVHLPGRRVSIDLDFEVESPIELHAHGASLIVLPLNMVAIETGLGVPPFIGSVELACSGDQTFDVVLEGCFNHSTDRLFDSVDQTELVAAVLDDVVRRIEDHVVSAKPTLGIPF
jgi:hypothetical protein